MEPNKYRSPPSLSTNATNSATHSRQRTIEKFKPKHVHKVKNSLQMNTTSLPKKPLKKGQKELSNSSFPKTFNARSTEHQNRVYNKVATLLAAQEESLMSECSFQPKINSSSKPRSLSLFIKEQEEF